jgi:arsenate reductase
MLLKILFLCTHNSCRSQMAEGWAKKIIGAKALTYSAGTDPSTIDPLAVKVMRESGIDISGQRSKSISELSNVDFDMVITVCDNAKESCPLWLKTTKKIHKNFTDPSAISKTLKDENEILNNYRKTRDEIKDFILDISKNL